MAGQLVRFICTGFMNTAVDFTVFNLLLAVSGHPGTVGLALINTAAVATAAANSYTMNRLWTFGDRHSSARQILRFLGATSIGAAINSLVVVAVVQLAADTGFSISWAANAGKILATALSASWNFISYRSWVFTPSAPKPFNQSVAGMVSLVVPAFNEEARLPERLHSLLPFLQRHAPAEILIVNDGSSDGTQDLAEGFARRHTGIQCLSYSPNRGKGYAVLTGVRSARGEYILYVDADQTFSPHHIEQIVRQLRGGHPIVIACRPSDNGERLKGENCLRRVMGQSFNRLVQTLLVPGLRDTQCGLKGFHRWAALELFSRQTIRRFAFDVELLTLARALHIPIKEVPVQAKDSAGSRVDCLVSPLQMAWDVVKIKLGLWINRYHLPGGNQALLDWGLGLLLFITALAVRLPWLWEVPRFIDELKEVQLGYQIFLGQTYPLHNAAHDIGALHNYILALLFQVFGLNLYLPRLYVAVTSALTVVMVYMAGYKLHHRLTGLLAAGLVMCSGMHILVTHMAWSNCTTPFFFMLALLLTCHAWEKRSRFWLAASGLTWALALQTHSSVIIYVSVIIGFWLHPSIRRATGWTWRTYLGPALLFALGYSNMIVYNIISWGGSFRWLGTKSYALETQLTASSYAGNLMHLLKDLFRSLSSTYASLPEPSFYLSRPFFLLSILLVSAGIFLGQEVRWRLMIWMMAAGILIIPMVNQRYAFYVSTRYIMPLILLGYLLMAYALVRMWPTIRSRTIRTAAASVIAGLVFLQLLPYYSYCQQAVDTNASNRMALHILSLARPESTLLLDDALPLENQPLPYLLALRQQPFAMVSGHNSASPKEEWAKVLRQHQQKPLIAVLNESTFRELKSLFSPTQINCLSCRVVIPKPTGDERRVYVIEVDSPECK